MSQDEGVSSTLAFAVAGLVMTLALGGLMLAARERGGAGSVPDEFRPAGARDDGEAESLLRTLLQTPGVADPVIDPGNLLWDSSGDCADSADTIVRLGLLQASGATTLSACKLANLQGPSGTNVVDYVEARRALGLNDRDLGFHLRTAPRLSGITYADLTLYDANQPTLDGLVVVHIGSTDDLDADANETAMLSHLLGTGVLRSLNDDDLLGLGLALTGDTNPLAVPPDSLSADILVVGAEVNQGFLALNSTEVAAFVQDGGTVIAFTTSLPHDGWLSGLTVGTSNVRALDEPDATHPLLNVPNRLAAGRFVEPVVALQPGPAASALVTVAATPDGVPLVRVSAAGTIGSGQVILVDVPMTMPLGIDEGGVEGHRLLHNLLVRHHQTLFVEYGGPVPDTSAVSTAAGWAVIDVPDTGLPNPFSPSGGDRYALEVVVRVFPEPRVP